MEFSSEKLLSFFYEFLFLTAEISFLFIFINMIMFYINSRYSFNKYLKNNVFSYFIAIFLGSITTFCSCSTIPVFNSLIKNNINHGVASAFLLTSPLINPMLITMLLSAFGFSITFYYIIYIVVFVFIISYLIGLIPARLLLKDIVTKEFQFNQNVKLNLYECLYKSLKSYKDIFYYVLFGMLIGAFLHNFMPVEFIKDYLSSFGIYGIFLASFVGLLLYIQTCLIIPLGVTLINVGFPIGIFFSFLIAGGGCSLPELILLKSMFKTRMMIIFILSILAMANVFGVLLYLFY